MRKKAMSQSSLPDIPGQDRRKPLCYAPQREKFISYEEIVSGHEKIVPVDSLTPDQKRKLVIERNRKGPSYTIQVMSGAKLTRDDVIREIEQQTDFGNMTVEAEISHLGELLAKIEKAL
jgi:hypothetical protein